MRIQNITTWTEFLSVVESTELRGWAFRGQRDASWPIVSSLTRHLQRFVEPNRWSTQEDRAIRVFRRKAHYFLTDPSALEDGLRCLALMQHHGAPTRLIDLTKSPYVAAHFALETATSEAAVFALNTPALWNDATPRSRKELTRATIDPRTEDNLVKYFLSNQFPVVWPGEPWTMDRRIVAQAGTFVLPGMVGESVEALLGQYDHPQELMIKLVLPPAIRTEAMQALYRMNITNATLFPDLDGLARSIAYELEVNWLGSSGPPTS
jgi:hypothetical protein